MRHFNALYISVNKTVFHDIDLVSPAPPVKKVEMSPVSKRPQKKTKVSPSLKKQKKIDKTSKTLTNQEKTDDTSSSPDKTQGKPSTLFRDL